MGQVTGPLLGGVLFDSSVAVPFGLAGGLLLALAPLFAWTGHPRTLPRGERAAKDKLAFRKREER